MAGHSKWANIRRKKEKTDSYKGKIFSKLGRELSIAVRDGGGSDPNVNYRLADVIAKAKSLNMPNDNILRCIKKAAGDSDGSSFEEVRYEGYGPGGVAVIVDAATDNRNRTAGDVRHHFDKYGGNLGTTGCVSFMFTRQGEIIIERMQNTDDEKVMMDAIEAGAEDVNSEEDYIEIITTPESFSSIRKVLEDKGYEFAEADIQMTPISTVKIEDESIIENMNNLIDRLEDLEDVIEVWHNWETDE